MTPDPVKATAQAFWVLVPIQSCSMAKIADSGPLQAGREFETPLKQTVNLHSGIPSKGYGGARRRYDE
jgi:hypothetical protein